MAISQFGAAGTSSARSPIWSGPLTQSTFYSGVVTGDWDALLAINVSAGKLVRYHYEVQSLTQPTGASFQFQPYWHGISTLTRSQMWVTVSTGQGGVIPSITAASVTTQNPIVGSAAASLTGIQLPSGCVGQFDFDALIPASGSITMGFQILASANTNNSELRFVRRASIELLN